MTKAILTSALACATLILVVLTAAVVGGVFDRPEPTTAEQLVEYLDNNAVNYGTETELFELADDLCELRQVGVSTEAFLLDEGWSMHDVSYWQWGVFNGGYCE